MILTIPVRRVSVRRNGVDEVVLKVMPGFCRLLADNPAENAAMGMSNGSGEILISNPFIPGMLDLQNTAGLPSSEELFIRLDDVQNSNPGVDDELASLSENLTVV